MDANTTRRQALAPMSLAMSAGMPLTAWNNARADTVGLPTVPTLPPEASLLRALTLELAKTPKRRDFKSVPMILTRPQEWDAEALAVILPCKGGPKQAFDNTELEGPWLKLMRNSMNAQVRSWKPPDFFWEITAGRIQAGVNPDRLSHEAMAADLTNHLIADVVLSPGAIGTLPELLLKGFTYAK